jgi:hypothetical protein
MAELLRSQDEAAVHTPEVGRAHTGLLPERASVYVPGRSWSGRPIPIVIAGGSTGRTTATSGRRIGPTSRRSRVLELLQPRPTVKSVVQQMRPSRPALSPPRRWRCAVSDLCGVCRRGLRKESRADPTLYPCAFCQRSRPVSNHWPAGRVCKPCTARARTYPTICAACGQSAVLIGLGDVSNRVCGPCVGATIDYRCRACGQPGVHADGRCSRCGTAEFLDGSLRGPDGQLPIQLDALPTGRQVNYVREILVRTAILVPRNEYLEGIEPWLDEHLAEQPIEITPHWSATTPSGTCFTVLAVTDDLSARSAQPASDVACASHWNLVCLDSRRRITTGVSAPAERPAPPSVFIDETIRLEQLHRGLHDDDIDVDIRAGGALILLYGIPTMRVLELRRDQLRATSGETFLVMRDHELLLPNNSPTC